MYFLVMTIAALAFLAAISCWLKWKRDSKRLVSAFDELKSCQAWLDKIQTSVPVMSHEIDSQDCLVQVSEEWLAGLGYAREDVIGRSFATLLSDNSSESYQKDIAKALMENGSCRDMPLQINKCDGEIMDILFSAFVERNQTGGFSRSYAIFSDNSIQIQTSKDLIKAQDELEERVRGRTSALDEAYEHLAVEMKERKRAEAILRTIAEGVYGTTGVTFFTSLVQYLSKALDMSHAIIGIYDEQNEERVQTLAVCSNGEILDNFSYDITGAPCAKVTDQGMCLYPQNVRHFFPQDDLLVSMDIASYIGLRLDDSSGAPVGLLIVMDQAPVEATGTITSMLQIYASRVAAELERLKQEEELTRARTLESLGRMAAGIAHEVNNPLTNASLNIQMLRKKLGFLVNDAPVLKRVEAVERNIERAANIAKELLLFSRERELDLDVIYINRILEKALAQIHYDQGAIAVKKQLAETPEMLGDTVKLEGLFINIFNNAIDAMSDGGVLTITSLVENNKIIVKVHDTGHGITQDNLSKVFDPFFTTKEVGTGTGLGLSIAYGVVRQHQGTIEVISADGDGATFVIKFPLYRKDVQ